MEPEEMFRIVGAALCQLGVDTQPDRAPGKYKMLNDIKNLIWEVRQKQLKEARRFPHRYGDVYDGLLRLPTGPDDENHNG